MGIFLPRNAKGNIVFLSCLCREVGELQGDAQSRAAIPQPYLKLVSHERYQVVLSQNEHLAYVQYNKAGS